MRAPRWTTWALMGLLIMGCGDDSGAGTPDATPGPDAASGVDAAPGVDAGPGVDAAPGPDATVTPADWDPADFDTVYEVGPGQALADPCDVPWESLAPSTLVRIHGRTEPYRCKWVINTEATQSDPVVVLGMPEGGTLPVITGEDAVTRTELSYWNEDRSVVKVGGSNLPTDQEVPSWIYLERLDIRSARPAYGFTDDGGSAGTYRDNAATVHIEIGEHIHVRGCVLHDAGNGLFTGSQSGEVVIAGNFIYDNGIDGSIYEHNSYTESRGILFEYNHYGPLRTGCLGNNLKDRSSGTVIRYNWIESGNRQLDLVETDYTELSTDPRYSRTFVYGNVLVEPDGAGNSQMVHYGGDGGDETMYRKGWLLFYHNTVISTRSGNTTLLRLSTNDESADVRNNVLYGTAGGDAFAISAGRGTVELRTNWLLTGWVDTHESSLEGTVSDLGSNLTGADPGFTDAGAQDFTLAAGSPCVDQAGPLATDAAANPVDRQYVVHQSGADRPDDGAPDLGAFER